MDLEARVVACAHQSVSLGTAKSFLGDGASVLAKSRGQRTARHAVDGVKVKLCALVVAEEQRVVLDAECEDQLRRRDEGRGVLEARLPVDAHHAEGERIVLIN